MKQVKYETEGPAKVSVQFTYQAPEIVHILIKHRTSSYNFWLDRKEFKDFLKAGMRMDESISEVQ